MEVKWMEKKGKKYLYFRFDERLTEQEAKDGIQKWQTLCAGHNEKTGIIWDCAKMKGYESAARVLWQGELLKTKGSIEVIWLITTSGMIKMGASLMSMLMPFQIKYVESESEIK